jgi:AraC family transcriptional regulator of adaptative response / DNA-3-methyladenine glycosylase II
VLSLPHSAAIAELEPLSRSNQVQLRLRLEDLRDLGLAVQRCRQWLDLDAEPAAVAEVLGADPVLAPLVTTRPGLRVPGAVDGFEMAVRAIIGQRISVSGATTLTGRLVAAFGEPLATTDGSLTRRFPTPERLAEADLDSLGVTRTRVTALRALARAVVKGDLELDRGADRDHTAASLLALPGVGPWTVAYVAMRALGDPDAFPATDLGLVHALRAHGLPTDQADITTRAERWRPWRAYAILHLWTSLGSTATSEEFAA